VSEFSRRLRQKEIQVYCGEEGLCKMAKDIAVDTLVVGIVGSSALLPILKALPNIKRLALANKEALVMAGDNIMREARKNSVKIVPVDSEHSAIFQCIESRANSSLKRIYLTGSGGPLLSIPRRDFKNITPRKAVNHPKWKMGKKISIDSATMMNKGLEVIEARHLFGLEIDKIKVLIHPEAAVHSMVEFIDGSILAQIGTCDMRLPIQYALTHPSRFTSSVKGVTFSSLKPLHFYQPDLKKFPCLGIAYEVARDGHTYPCVLNASNEVVVSEFLKGRMKFTDIPKVIRKVLRSHKVIKNPELEDILEIDKWARSETREILNAITN
jgi:1-deoxy-D-xylulose-5-phosphate reductoisomerase